MGSATPLHAKGGVLFLQGNGLGHFPERILSSFCQTCKRLGVNARQECRSHVSFLRKWEDNDHIHFYI